MCKKLFYLLCVLFIPVVCLSQHKYPPTLRPSEKITKEDDDCAERANRCAVIHKYTAEQRLSFFPFSVGAEVRLISYESMEPNTSIRMDGEPEQTLEYKPEQIYTAIRSGEFVVDYARVKEFQSLSRTAIDKLTDILYNVGYTPLKCRVYSGGLGASCYEPRNAILFLDKSGKVTQYLEICFGCQRYYYSSSKFKPIEYCDNKFELLRKFFVAQGIGYGTKRHGLQN